MSCKLSTTRFLKCVQTIKDSCPRVLVKSSGNPPGQIIGNLCGFVEWQKITRL